ACYRPAVELGRYRVLRPLGEGGMAEVLEAVAVGAEGFERRVAIKRLRPGCEHDGGLVGMFLDEARIASRLHHANIVSVLDYGVVDGLPFQVRELVDGLDAGKLWARGQERGQPLPLPLALHVGTTIAHALHHAHQARDGQGRPLGIVHRDVSPGNILISWDGDVLLADFGIAFAEQRSERTRTGVAKGTVSYWAPEQATGGQVDGRTDVFSLAATVHRLIAGHSPLAGENALADLLVGRPLPLDPALPADVAQVLARALHRDKAQRHADAAELAAALGGCMTRRLQEDPRSSLRRWLSSLRDEPRAAAPVGRFDALLGLEWVVVGEDDGVRTFVAHGSGTEPAGVLAGTTPVTVPVAGSAGHPPTGGTVAAVAGSAVAGGTVAAIAVAAVDPPRSSSFGPRRRSGVPLAVAVLLVLGAGVGIGAWAWRAQSIPGTVASSVVSDGPSAVLPAGPRVPPSPVGSTEGLGGGSGRAEAPAGDTGAESEVMGLTSTGAGLEPDASEPPARVVGRPTVRRPARDPLPEPPDVVGTGFLSIGGSGALRAEIFVDGRRHGHAPRQLELPAGRHHVVLRDQSGAEVASHDVDLRPAHTRSSPFRWVVPG
ncbi:MAG: protein kinase, partial [Myxococcales bacterium]|nr:protein kinase [Myxococcales bacterium]